MATQTLISLEEYLKKIPDPDVEYVDGYLKERPVVSTLHGLLQSEICGWFISHRKEWKVLSAVEARMRTSATSVRLPDVVIDKIGEWPMVLVNPPMIVLEILSIGDSMAELEEKCDAYEAMGIPNIWLINPARRKGKVWKHGNWIEVTRFEAAGTEIYLDVDWLFAQIDGFKTAE